MIIGSGLIAKALKDLAKDRDDIIIFASGVSNSQENKIEEFQREIELLEKNLKIKKFILYFSSIDVLGYNSNSSLYIKHKYEIEQKVKKIPSLILRLPQLVGHNQNQNNLVPYLYNCIVNNKEFELKINYQRNLIDVDDLARVISHIINQKASVGKIINIFNPHFIKVIEIVKIIEDLSKIKAIYKISEEKFSFVKPELSKNYLSILKKSNVVLNKNYNFNLIKKYFFLKKFK